MTSRDPKRVKIVTPKIL